MKKAITSIIAIVLLVSMTVVAGAIAFVWMNSVQSSLEQKVGASIENAPVGCTKLNLIAIKGDRAIVQNVGCDTVTNVTVLINGHLTNYTLNEPIAPGESAVITYAPQQAGEDLVVSIVGSWGETTMSSPAELNTEEAGFTSGTTSSSQPTNPLHINSVSVVEFSDHLEGYCNAYSDNENDLLRYNFSWTINNIEAFSNIEFKEGSISVGYYHSCGLLTNGSALCWGDNTYGQLGDGTTTSSSVPVFVAGEYTFDQVSAGRNTSCGLLENGSILCWGDNTYGQLGNGTAGGYSTTPQFVYGDYNFSKVFAGVNRVCGILYNNLAMCWGAGGNGLLGTGDYSDRYVPAYVYGNYNFTMIADTAPHSCGLLTNGSVVCWGINFFDEIGSPNVGNPVPYPTFVYGDYTFSYVGVGETHSCGILTNGSALCWGGNYDGELGNGSIGGQSAIPVFVAGDYNFSTISGGGTWVDNYPYTCGLLTNGSALCWGDNTYGQLGNGTAGGASGTPLFVEGDYTFVKVTANGLAHSCGLLTNGSALCWGYNGEGQLGNGTAGGYSATPVFVSGDYQYINNTYYWNSSVSTSKLSKPYYKKGDSVLFQCTVMNHEYLSNSTNTTIVPETKLYSFRANITEFSDHLEGYCNAYSDNSYDLLTYNYSWFVNGNLLFSNFKFKTGTISAGYYHSCGILENGSAVCWGDNDYGELGDDTAVDSAVPVFVAGDYTFSRISGGNLFSCAVLTNHSGVCWGRNSYGQLGDGTTVQRNASTFISGGYNFSDITTGGYHSCGILVNNTAICWGYNGVGCLGDGTTTNSYTPVFVSGDYGFRSLDAGKYFTCGVLTNGSALCWGDNTYGQLGDGTTTSSSVPVFVAGDYVFSKISSGNAHVCGLLANHSALCWGDNTYGQLGNGTAGGYSTTPIFVSGNYNFSEISVGYYHSCGILTNGSAVCWGSNSDGRLGDGTTTSSSVPVFVAGDYNFTQIDGGVYHTLVVLQNSSAFSLGGNGYGQLGNGTAGGYSTTPQFVYGDYSFINNSHYWRDYAFVSSISPLDYSSGDIIEFRCNVYSDDDSSNNQYFTLVAQ